MEKHIDPLQFRHVQKNMLYSLKSSVARSPSKKHGWYGCFLKANIYIPEKKTARRHNFSSELDSEV